MEETWESKERSLKAYIKDMRIEMEQMRNGFEQDLNRELARCTSALQARV